MDTLYVIGKDVEIFIGINKTTRNGIKRNKE